MNDNKRGLNLFCWHKENKSQTGFVISSTQTNTLWRSIRPNYPAAPAATNWLSMCLFISVLRSFHWLLGHPRLRRRADRADVTIEHMGKWVKSREGRTQILPVTHTKHAHTHCCHGNTRLHSVTSGRMQRAMQTLVRGEVVCVCVHVLVSVPARTRLHSLKKGFSSSPPSHRVAETTLTGSSDRSGVWCFPGVSSDHSPLSHLFSSIFLQHWINFSVDWQRGGAMTERETNMNTYPDIEIHKISLPSFQTSSCRLKIDEDSAAAQNLFSSLIISADLGLDVK